MAIVCYACGSDVGARERIGRRDRCERCGVDLHSCRQCRFFDPRAYNACAEPQAERVLAKERANFCDYFAPAAPETSSAGGNRPAPSPTAPRDARADLERLFRRR
jgi:hypothetical protein